MTIFRLLITACSNQILISGEIMEDSIIEMYTSSSPIEDETIQKDAQNNNKKKINTKGEAMKH